MADTWGSDGPVSVPEPAAFAVGVSFGGFCFGAGGMQHELSRTDLEEVFAPTFEPGQ